MTLAELLQKYVRKEDNENIAHPTVEYVEALFGGAVIEKIDLDGANDRSELSADSH